MSNMIFRTPLGKLIIVNKYDFKNDKLYYCKIMSCLSLYGLKENSLIKKTATTLEIR